MDIPSPILLNAAYLESAAASIERLLRDRVHNLFHPDSPIPIDLTGYLPAHLPEACPARVFLTGNKATVRDVLLINLALAPEFFPHALEPLRTQYADNSPIIELGAYQGPVHKGLIPTWQTALLLLAGTDLPQRNLVSTLYLDGHALFRQGFLRLEQQNPAEPVHASVLLPGRDLIDIMRSGKQSEPEFGPGFPAQRVETNLEWHDLVLDEEVMRQVEDIHHWISHEATIMRSWGMSRKIAPGFRALFYGPPGTGKTLTATLIGKATGREVYRIDLSMVVSKYIGETEKNLRAVFDKAQSRGWILFFDEADALFGKRTDVSDSRDRYANQEVSYLLQRVENFDGVVILATNNRDNMDKAFTRRFQVVVPFAMPTPAERLRIWRAGLPAQCSLGPELDLVAIADRFELAGGNIMNVVRYCALRAAVRGEAVIHLQDILDGIRTEYRKAGRMMQ